jgi:hypothetical protein
LVLWVERVFCMRGFDLNMGAIYNMYFDGHFAWFKCFT